MERIEDQVMSSVLCHSYKIATAQGAQGLQIDLNLGEGLCLLLGLLCKYLAAPKPLERGINFSFHEACGIHNSCMTHAVLFCHIALLNFLSGSCEVSKSYLYLPPLCNESFQCLLETNPINVAWQDF